VRRRTFTVGGAAPPSNLAQALSQELGVAEEQARALISGGAVYLDGRRQLRPKSALRAGQKVTVVLSEGGRAAGGGEAASPPLSILFEDGWVLSVNKPAGTTAQPTPAHTEASLLDRASVHLGRPAGLVHRLDRETSGVTVFGKTSEATSALAAQFRDGTAQKRYLAVVTGSLPERGEIDLPLSRDPGRVGRYRASRTANGVAALTRFARLHHGPAFALVALYPKTGRTHQLRVHLQSLGCPIAGDRLYGGAAELEGVPIPRTLLHAQALAVKHPGSKAPLLLEAPLPEELARWFALVQVDAPRGPLAPS
jgi:23S rRNA pseudouridine1911/1915/1917 synthase